jgi:acyl-CoA thioester hydrolase
MSGYRFYHPIHVRYGDLDPQGHVNNAKFLTYFEEGRVEYVQHLGMWPGGSFKDLGIIVANAHVEFREPVYFGQDVRVGVRVAEIGNKSLKMEYSLEDAPTGRELASGSTVLVAFDYRKGITVPVPDGWREAIDTFEKSEIR